MRCQVPRRFCRALRASLPAFCIFCALAHTARSDWTLATSAALRHDDNVSNARDADQIADSSAAASVSLLQLMAVGTGFSVAGGAAVSGEIYDHLSGLNNASLEGVLSLRKKWGLGALAPWVRAGVSVGRIDYDDNYRNATIYRGSLEAGKRIDERWNFWAKYAFESRRATPAEAELYGVSSDAFSQDSRSFHAGLQYSLSPRVTLSLGGLVRHGDVVSTTQANAYIFANSKAVAPDPTFGPGAYAYRLNGTTIGAKLAVEYSLSAHSLLGCGFQRLQTRAEGGHDYADSMPELTWNYRF